MSVNPVEAQIRLYVKYLGIPTFGDYNELLKRMKPNNNIGDLLLELIKTESLQRQWAISP